MKNWKWQQWTAFGICVAAVIAEIVSICVAPWAAIFGGAMLVLGFIAGYLAKKNNIINK